MSTSTYRRYSKQRTFCYASTKRGQAWGCDDELKGQGPSLSVPRTMCLQRRDHLGDVPVLCLDDENYETQVSDKDKKNETR